VLSRGTVAVFATAVALIASAAVGGCGAEPATKTVTVTTAAPSADTATTTGKSKQRTHSGGASMGARQPKAALRACDANVSVKTATTTCPFAENVFYEYWRGLEQDASANIQAYSPALGRFLAVDCKDGEEVECRTNAGALVRFPLTAVQAYTVKNATKYAHAHTVSKGPRPTAKAPSPASPPGSDCDPNYEGACLDPRASDYDCEGGSGDGPEYTGTVTVVGDDPFGLDRDGDGIACE
jgi:hypothetical protein